MIVVSVSRNICYLPCRLVFQLQFHHNATASDMGHRHIDDRVERTHTGVAVENHRHPRGGYDLSPQFV